jgi:hypothetical protein
MRRFDIKKAHGFAHENRPLFEGKEQGSFMDWSPKKLLINHFLATPESGWTPAGAAAKAGFPVQSSGTTR